MFNVLGHTDFCALRHGLFDSTGVKKIALRFGEQENVFMAPGAAVPDALRDAPGLVPDDVLAQIPAVRAQGKGQRPGDADQIFWLHSPGCLRALVRRPGGELFIKVPVFSAAAGVAVPDVESQGAIGAQHPPHLSKDFQQPGDVLLRRGLLTDLAGHAVIPEAEVGRRGDAAVDAVRV